MPRRLLFALALCLLTSGLVSAAEQARPIRLLFLGDNGPHRPAERFVQVQPILAARGIELVYTDRVGDLNPRRLADFDGLVIYANIERIAPEQERALLDYVANGKGFIPIHCASYCFLNSPRYVELVGAQFQRHETGTFRETIAEPDHAIMQGFGGFESWDETYVHTRHNERDRIVLSYRIEGDHREPWTWVRTHGDGRVFYTAWGHDRRTWGHPGFHNLLERGLRWAVGGDPGVVPPYADRPEMTPPRTDVEPFEYVEAEIPFYPAGERWGTLGEPIRKMQKPLPAEESLKHFVTPLGFEVRLFASEPDLVGKPIAMNWDERGRLWVLETVDYPNELQPPGRGRDRIRICEDTTGDGRADMFAVFAEDLSIPTSQAFAYGGVIVHQAPHTLFLKDTTGDDRADVREVLFTGWSTSDTHAGPSNLRYGLDGWYYGMVGYAGFEGRIAGERQSFRTGFYRFRLEPPASGGHVPVVAAFEFLRNTSNNSWGVGFSEDGQLFGSTANGNPSMHLPVPNRYYERVRGWSSSVLGMISEDARYHPITDKVRQVDHHGNFTSAAGHALYTARTYPREYWNRTAFVSDPTGHLTATFVLTPDGASFRSKNSWNLVASDDEWSAPIMAEVGPDGNVWIIDWYNYIVQHNPTPAGYRTGRGNAYETPLRDKTHGRIYRVVYTGGRDRATVSRSQAPPRSRSQAPPGNAGREAPPRDSGVLAHATQSVAAVRSQAEPGNEGSADAGNEAHAAAGRSLAGATPDRLAAALRDPNMFWRLHAQRLLIERGQTDVVPALIELARDAGVDSVGLNAPATHALWTLHGLGALDGSHAEAGRAAADALRHASPGVRRNAALVLPPSEDSVRAIVTSNVVNDVSPQVRLAALLALSDMPASDETVGSLLSVLDDPRNLSDRWIVDAATSAAAARSAPFLREIAGHRFDRTPHTNVLALVGRVAEHFARSSASASAQPAGADLDSPNESIAPLVVALPEAHEQIAAAIIGGLARGWPRDVRPALDAPAEKALVALVTKLPPEARGQLVGLASGWGSRALERYAAEIAAAFLAQVEDETRSDAARARAAAQLVEFRPDDAGTIETLLEQITPRTSPQLASGLLEAVGRSQAAAGGAAVAERLGAFTPSVRPAAIRVLLGRSEWTAALIDALQEGTLRTADLTLDQQQALAAHPDRRLATRFRRLLERGGGLPDADRQKVIDELAPLLERTGDAVAGKEVFKKQCAKCHTHSGEGTKIGPDLTGMAVHPKLELLTQILDPSRSVEGNYRMYTVATLDGRVLNGLLASETRTTIELFDTEGKKHVVLREDIDELVASNKSLMPEGFEKQVPPEEMVDLLEFLTARGKYLPLPLEKVATIASDRSMFVNENAPAERLIFPDWAPKLVDGVPFVLVDPENGRRPNVILLYGPQGRFPPQMPRSVRLPVNAPAAAVHLLSGVSGWGHPYGERGTVSLFVRLHYADGSTEEHALKNGEHFADYIRRVDVPGSKFAFDLRGRQIRYLAVEPQRAEPIREIEFVKGPDRSAPVIMAVTVETRSDGGER